ncbi:unnamed protein product [Periconia digitata]|uniref:Uncharacterized protein n=1 Tax=Periconia digitata TaxID=1303443 RepID=A0A9W4UJ37_9PLEO|nr:unnamed protein product [Periconia digitata]
MSSAPSSSTRFLFPDTGPKKKEQPVRFPVAQYDLDEFAGTASRYDNPTEGVKALSEDISDAADKMAWALSSNEDTPFIITSVSSTVREWGNRLTCLAAQMEKMEADRIKDALASITREEEMVKAHEAQIQQEREEMNELLWNALAQEQQREKQQRQRELREQQQEKKKELLRQKKREQREKQRAQLDKKMLLKKCRQEKADEADDESSDVESVPAAASMVSKPTSPRKGYACKRQKLHHSADEEANIPLGWGSGWGWMRG